MNKIVLGIIVGLAVGIFANPLMPPAFFIVGGLCIWWFASRQTNKPANPNTKPGEEASGS